MATEPISRHLGRSAELASVKERLQRIERLQERYRRVAPERLQEASRVCAIDGTIVVVCAANGAIASALRQLAPRILQALRTPDAKDTEDQEVTQIRIEVQVSATAPKRPPRPRGELPRDRLGEVAQGLAEGPLKDELERIATPQRSRTRSKM